MARATGSVRASAVVAFLVMAGLGCGDSKPQSGAEAGAGSGGRGGSSPGSGGTGAGGSGVAGSGVAGSGAGGSGAGTGGSGAGGSAGTTDGGLADIATVDVPPAGPPPSGGTTKKLMPTRSEVLGLHRSGCSYGEAPAGTTPNRWCAISRPAAMLGRLELWVLNVTAASSPNADVKCDGSSPHCLRLTGNLFSGQPDDGPSYPSDHRFFGDTLIYYADNSSGPADLYKGPVYAWRPGWTAGRPISSPNAVLCSAHARANVAVCLENVSPPTEATVSWDLHAGSIEGGPMKKVATIFPVHPITEASQWGVAFTRNGDYLLFSTPAAAMGPEALNFIKTSDIGTRPPTQVAMGVSRWSVNAAGNKWFYLRDYNYNVQGEPSGALIMRDFPMGAQETRIQGSQIAGATLGMYQILVNAMDQDAGLGFVAPVMAGRGNYRILKNPAGSYDDPNNVVTVITDMSLRRTPIFTPSLDYALYAKTFDEVNGTTDTWVTKTDGTGACSLTTSLNSGVFGYPFSEDGKLVFWMDNFDMALDAGEGWVASTAGCANKRRFSTGIDYWFVKGSELLLYSDTSDGQKVSLKFARFNNGVLADTPTEIKAGVGRIFSVVGSFDGVLYQVASPDEAMAGVYHYKF